MFLGSQIHGITAMARRKRNGKFKWRSKRANHGKLGSRGKSKGWGKKSGSK